MNQRQPNEAKKIRLGISTCLMGEPVRYDGGHKRDRFLTDVLSRFVEYVPVCPEVECGLSTPREAMRLVGDPQRPRLIGRNSGTDHTRRMEEWAADKVRELAREELGGFVFKSDSPSSGMERVKVYNDRGMAQKSGVGLFARAFMEAFPLLPVEEEGRLHDAGLRENYLERIFAFQRWRQQVAASTHPARLVDFHARHKLLLMAHDVKAVGILGRLTARAGEADFTRLKDTYISTFMTAMKKKATKPKHVNVMMHILGYFKSDLTGDEKQEALELIDQYRLGHLPLIVPVTLLNHFIRKYNQPYLQEQHYLHPGAPELNLRNHV